MVMVKQTNICTIFAWSFCVVLTGCGTSVRDGEAGAKMIIDSKLKSDPSVLSVAQMEKFRPGRLKNEVLADIQWQVGTVNAGLCESKSIMTIDYTLLPDPAAVYKQESFHAIFVDGKFNKFIPWDTGVQDKPAKFGDCGRLVRLMKSQPISVDELGKQANANSAPKKRVDYGLTAAWLILQTKSPKAREATSEDYKKNAALRVQFNPARIDIGMTKEDVERIFNAKPIETGELEMGTCNVYGSNESFPIDPVIHFVNTIIVFREGRTMAITNFPAGDLGRDTAPKGIVEYFRRRDTAVDPLNKKNEK